MTKSTNDTICLQSNGQLIPSQVFSSLLIKYFSMIIFNQFSHIKPTNRNSARLNTYKHFAVLSCGLLENDEPTNEIWLLDTSKDTMNWILFHINGSIIPRQKLLK